MTITVSNPFKLNITASDTGPFVPEYYVPTSPGEVVQISGDDGPVVYHTDGTTPKSGGSAWKGNVPADVRPGEMGGPTWSGIMFGGDSASSFIASYSQAGAVVTAGRGGHKDSACFGAMLFDFADAKWKRVWTRGQPSQDNTTSGDIDVRTGTKVHNVLHAFGDLIEHYSHNDAVGGAWAGACWNHEHWGATTNELQKCPKTTDPRDQFWEISRKEPYPYSATTTYGPGGTDDIASGPHGTQFPGQWSGNLQGHDPATGYVNNCLRWGTPTPPGTLAPTQSGLPAPSHTWDNNFEMTPDEGGGPKGSYVVGRHLYAGIKGATSMYWSHRFDLDTGIWHKYSTNNSQTVTQVLDDYTPPGGGPWKQDGSVASTVDPVKQRVYMTGLETSKSNRVNYLNLSDKTWRNLSVGTSVAQTAQTYAMTVDPDRRLLILQCAGAPHLRALDLATFDSETIPTTAVGGWRTITYTDVPGITEHRGTHTGMVPWRYCPFNGKFYRVWPRWFTSPGSITRPASNSAIPPLINVLQRLTPPPIIANPTLHYYTNSTNWTLDEITLSQGLPMPCVEAAWAAVCQKWFFYVPALQCFAWLPLDGSGNTSWTSRRGVYLIKPY